MNGYVDRVMNDILRVVEPSQSDRAVRNQIINELQGVMQSIESLRGATIEPFGSFVSDLYSKWGDLDVSIQLHNGSYISTAGKKLKETLLKDVRKAFRRNGGWCKLQLVSHARVPIVKIENVRHKISCDISIENLVGQMKSKILLWLNDIDGRFRDMVLLVKEWAKAHNINNPRQGTFNSYTLSLLVIFHFQTCSPAIFPPLKDIYPGNVVDNLKAVRAEVEREIEQTCAANIARFKSRTANQSSLSELFISFLAKFSDLSSEEPNLVICPYTGQRMEIESNMRWLTKEYPIFVEDPFEQPENPARAISARQLTRISEAFRMTHFRLTSPYEMNSILYDLARPQILQQLNINSSLSATAPAFNMGNYPPIRPQVHQARAMHPHPQIQHARAMHPSPQIHHAGAMHPHPQIHRAGAMHPRPQIHQAGAMHPRPQIHRAGAMHPRPQIQQQFQDNAPRFSMADFPPINPEVPLAGTMQFRPSVQHKTPNTRHLSNPSSSKEGEPSNSSKTYNGQGQQNRRPQSQKKGIGNFTV